MTNESEPRRRFLTAEWRHLLMLNFPVAREVLEPLVPAGTALDTYQGTAYVSLVGFLFTRARLLGVPVPFHQVFEEVNLRFYVRRFSGEDWRRGVVFVKEIVPRTAVALVARVVYNENYVALPMRHSIRPGPDGTIANVEYAWELDGTWNRLAGSVAAPMRETAPGSLEEFIAEHYWGYAAQKDGGSLEYQVEHPRWKVAPVGDATFEGDVSRLYAPEFREALNQPPASAFLAGGSAVNVFHGRRISS